MARKQAPRPARPSIDPWRAVRLLAGLALTLAIGVGAGLEIAAPSATEASVAQLRKAEAERDSAQIRELTTMARNTKQAVTPVLTGLAAGRPPDGWKAVMSLEVQRYSITVSGATATNVARGALRNAVELLAAAVDTYVMAQTAAPESRAALLELAGRQRILAVATWSVAGTQLDQLSIDAGNGHQHVYLSDKAEGGAMTPDGAAEGSS
ncbi:hypothetical protein [Allorhizocola rhizosphaerae]|uniref:hypothetical protein n=1 Tax=Allorhizocola rhizosphaerae TaxID=1872709 RepID=UPI000E3C5E20|nr:hypothetical protein [Allorhizocola rhizosphaerae]